MIFELIRSIILPFEKIEKHIPHVGKIVDIGCGHGVMSILLAKKSQKRKVLGVDPSKEKIGSAKKNAIGIKNVEFKSIYADKLPKKSFDSVFIADVLYLLPKEEKQQLLKTAYQLLKPNGQFFLKETDTKPRWKYYWMLLEEYVMVNILKLTYSDHTKIYLQGQKEYRKMLKEVGFKVKKVVPINGILPYPHILFISSK